MDYKNGKVYRFVSNVSGEQYVGSTTQPLSKRKNKHLTDYNSWKQGVGDYLSSFKIVEAGDCDIFLLENYPCESKEQLRARERYWQESIEGGCVNINRAIVTKEETLQKMREYHWSHRQDRLDRYQREKEYWHEKVDCKICGKSISRQHFKEHEVLHNKTTAQLEEERQNRINKREASRVVCGCGVSYQSHNKKSHENGKKHVNWLKVAEHERRKNENK